MSRVTPEDDLHVEDMDDHSRIGADYDMDAEHEAIKKPKNGAKYFDTGDGEGEKHLDIKDLDGDGDLAEELMEVELSEDIYSLASQLVASTDKEVRESTLNLNT